MGDRPGFPIEQESQIMKPEFTKNGYCNCHQPDEWKVNDKIPISYCEELNDGEINKKWIWFNQNGPVRICLKLAVYLMTFD